jgi:2-oxoglutarate ferredoxin oxidoreductase subunit alpha
LLSEHPETIEADALRHDVPIERGELVTQWPEENGNYKRFAFTKSGVSPRALPGTANTVYIAATDDHDEEGVLISDVFTSPPVRRKIQEKRMTKVERALQELPSPKLEGPEDADVTLIGWGSSKGVIKEAVALLQAQGISANQLHFKYLHPFHASEALGILQNCRKTVCVECNYTAQFARHLRAETGYGVHDTILKYDGEPLEPAYIVRHVRAILNGMPRSLDVSPEEAREMAYHYIRSRLGDTLRPTLFERIPAQNGDEPTWRIELASRDTGETRGELIIGVETGAMYAWKPVAASKGQGA